MISLYNHSKKDINEIIERYYDAYGVRVLPTTYERLEKTILKNINGIAKLGILSTLYEDIERNIINIYPKISSLKKKITNGEELNEQEEILLQNINTDVLGLYTGDIGIFKSYVDTTLIDYNNILQNNDKINEELHEFIESHKDEYVSPIFNNIKQLDTLITRVNDKRFFKRWVNQEPIMMEIAERFMELEMFLLQKEGRFLFIDTETTDTLKAGRNCLPVQITYILTDTTRDMNIISKGNMYILQDIISEGAIAVHGMTRDILLKINASLPEDKVDEVADMIKNPRNLFVAHNVAFDSRVISNFGYQAQRQIYPRVKFCTYQASRRGEINKGSDKGSGKLENLCEYNGITNEDISSLCKELFLTTADYHNSMYDTAALYLLFKANYDGILKKE